MEYNEKNECALREALASPNLIETKGRAFMKIVIANVLYSPTDETYYVLNSSYEKAADYQADTVENAIEMLKKDGWVSCGKMQRSDYVNVAAMRGNKDEIIAIWQE